MPALCILWTPCITCFSKAVRICMRTSSCRMICLRFEVSLQALQFSIPVYLTTFLNLRRCLVLCVHAHCCSVANAPYIVFRIRLLFTWFELVNNSRFFDVSASDVSYWRVLLWNRLCFLLSKWCINVVPLMSYHKMQYESEVFLVTSSRLWVAISMFFLYFFADRKLRHRKSPSVGWRHRRAFVQSPRKSRANIYNEEFEDWCIHTKCYREVLWMYVAFQKWVYFVFS